MTLKNTVSATICVTDGITITKMGVFCRSKEVTQNTITKISNLCNSFIYSFFSPESLHKHFSIERTRTLDY